MKSVSERDAEAMLNSMVGVLGEAFISKLVYAFIKEHVVEFMKNHICKAIGVETNNSITPEVIAAPKSAPAPDREPEVIDVTPTSNSSNSTAPRIGKSKDLPAPTNEISINEMRRLEYYYRSIL
jgi:hypothetical protein